MTDKQTPPDWVLIDNAVKAEREAIIKWLRKHGYRQVAMMIEEGEYLK